MWTIILSTALALSIVGALGVYYWQLEHGSKP